MSRTVTNDELAAWIDDAYIVSFLVGTVSLVALEFAVVLTARYTDWSDTMLNRIYAIFTDNPRRIDRGQPLRNQVDVCVGY